MALRPIAFSIPSTTELKVTFTDKLSKSLSISNFTVESLSGAVKDLEVTGITVSENVVIIKTRPQIAGDYYLLKLLDTNEVIFSSERGARLVDDSVSRELFFVGIDDVNPIRDRMFRIVPDLFNLEGTVLKNIISSQANELYRAQKDIGSVLSDNYLCELIVDEPRVRSAGAFDRMANENAFEIIRVSDKLTGESIRTDKIEFNSDLDIPRMEETPVYPISLQQVIVEDEEISVDSDDNSFDGFLLNLKKKNIVKLLSVLLIREADSEDCDGNLGIFYDIERYKYTLQNNRYDQDFAFSLKTLNSNQVLLSEFGNIPRPTIFDRIIISYAYKDLSRKILTDDIEVSRVEFAEHESVPSNSSSFFLDNAPIVTSSNKIIESTGGLSFQTSENDATIPVEFSTEIVFNQTRLPSFPGEWSCDYSTGEVFVYGATDEALGTNRNNYVVSYNYRKEFKLDLDYSISDQDLVATPDRDLSKKESEIFIRYDKVFSPGTDYEINSHIEVMPEFVENRLNQSFSILPKQTPVTSVFRILNQTTGEVYTPIYHSDSEIFFAGNRSPEIKTIEGEKANYKKVRNEELQVIGEFIAPTFSVKITSTASNNSIQFTPGIPAELISQNSNEYFFRELDIENDEVSVEDIQIRFFGEPDSGNLISSAGISSTATAPSVGSTVIIGPKTYKIMLDNTRLLNKSGDALGSLVNTSLSFGDKEVFVNEKYYESVDVNPGLDETTSGGITRALTVDKGTTFYDNLSKLRVVGDYAVDYRYGFIYVAIGLEQDINVGNISYSYATHSGVGDNILTVSSAANKVNSPDELTEANIIYGSTSSDVDSISILDIENGLTIFDDETEAVDLDDNLALICEVREDYTVVVPNNILAINSIFRKTDLEGASLNASDEADRQEEYAAEDLTATVKDGGRNIYDPSCISFEKNVIDLKKTISKRAYENGDSDFTFSVLDTNARTFKKAVRSLTGEVFFDENLNITKIASLSIVGAVYDGSDVIVSIDSSVSIEDADADGDFLLDSDGNRFEILEVNSFLSTIKVSSPALNNSSALQPVLGSGEIIVKASVTFTDTGFTVVIPSDSGISNGEKFEITYLTDLIPDIGTPLVIDYRYGFQYLDYTYLNDELVVWYEYGDNALDWSISDTLSEGERYFVTYKYGALRNSLRTNFGSLTNIPFFRNFSIDVDRELYRRAIKGTLQTFPKGPTIPAFTELVKSFTDIEPDIRELAFGSWILGRDYASLNEVEYDGILSFGEGKFGGGLVYNDDVSTNVSAISSLPLSEGTLECWVRPDWSGVANDAELTFNLKYIGDEKVNINSKQNPFDYGYVIYPTDGAVGGTDPTGDGLTIFNFRTDADSSTGFSQGRFGIFKEFEHLTPLTSIDLKATIRIDKFGIVLDSLVSDTGIQSPSDFNLASMLTLDDEREVGLDFKLSLISNFKYEVNDIDLESEEIPDFDPPYASRKCKCSFENTQSELAKINDLLIEVELDKEFEIDNAIENYVIVDDKNSVLVIGDSQGYFYEVIKLLDHEDNELKTISSDVSKLVIKKIPVNNPSLTTNWHDDINNALPKGTLSLYVKSASATVDNADNSYIAFRTDSDFILDWSTYSEIRINRTPQNNLVNFLIRGKNYKFFYTDFSKVKTDTNDLNGVLFASLDDTIISEFVVLKQKITFENIFDISDVFIGSAGFNPESNPFSISLNDSPDSPLGVPNNIDRDEGIFIWFDELCQNPFSDEAGQWIFRTRGDRRFNLPTDVIVHGEDDWETISEPSVITKTFGGIITTDGEFSSVVRSYKDEADGCALGEVCSSTFRYCGNELLEENGWYKLDDSESDLINAFVSGTPTERKGWVKHGNFTTNASKGIYRMGPSIHSFDCIEEESINGNMVYTKIPCSGGNIEYNVSMKIVSAINTIGTDIGTFDGLISGNLNGIVPIHINDGDIHLKLALGRSNSGDSLVLVIDGENGDVRDIISFIWNDGLFHEYSLVKDKDNGIISIYIDNLLLSRISLSEFNVPDEFDLGSIYSQEYISLELVDGNLVNSEKIHSLGSNTIAIDLIFFAGQFIDGNEKLEDTDIFIHTDSQIEFEFNIDELDAVDGYDLYDGYDGYGALIGIDEMLISSDRRRYIVDSAEADGDRRFSIYKDGKGFLNFRIYDDSLSRGKESTYFNIATNIKHFVAGELHHIAASWKLNSVDEKDEMHLFIDGQEAPNIYRFGGKIPVAVNDKFSDVSKESLQNFLVKDIDYCQIHSNGTTVANSSIFRSEVPTFDDDMVGRSIIVTGSTIYPTLIGRELIIKSVIDSEQVTLCSGSNLEIIIHTTSTNDIEWKFAPIVGHDTSIMTDLRNSRFAIFRTNSSGETEEFGGILYSTEGGTIDIISGSNVLEPKFRANIDTRIIEFVGRNSNCKYFETINSTDVDIHIETFGLNLENCKFIAELSASSYSTSDDYTSGLSVLRTRSSEPVSIDDVIIRRIVLEKTALDIGSTTEIDDNKFLADFEIDLDGDSNKLTSESGRVIKSQNLGRRLELFFDSDNINYCDFNINEDGYQDGYLDGQPSTITIYGTTIDGVDEETFFIRRNGAYSGEKFFTTVSRVSGSVELIDEDYFELGVIGIKELNPITVSDNNGERAEVLDYRNGAFILTTNGSNGTFPFEIHKGFYDVEYPSHLRINIPNVGRDLFIGSDFNGEQQFGGAIDDFRIITELSSDTRITEISTSGTRSVTEDFNKSIPHCPDSQTTLLIPFDDPINFQIRKLRTLEFLNEEENYKFRLKREQVEDLIPLVNNQEEFISYMVNEGFTFDDSIKSFFEVHKAEGGPFFNISNFYRNYSEFITSSDSVNSNFGFSGLFKDGSSLLLDNSDGKFRANEGTIEFWTSPILDTSIDAERRYYVDISSASRDRVLSKSSRVVELTNPAKEIISIKLITSARAEETFYTEEEKSQVLFDEISRSEISGRLEGGTGTDKDFSIGSKLSADGKKVLLATSLPGENIDVLVTYIPIDSSGDRISIFKDEYGKMTFAITANGIDHIVNQDIDWKKNTWHRVMCTYRTNSAGFDSMRIFVDGQEGGIIRYGTGLIYGTGFVYGQYAQKDGQAKNIEYKIQLGNDLKILSLGSDIFGDSNINSRIDNLRFSRIIRPTVKDSSGNLIDLNYSSNINTVSPVVVDGATTYIQNFDEDGEKVDKFATIIDPESGIFEFDIDVYDNFDKVIGINNGEIEDLIIDLVERLKPAHANALVKFIKTRC